HHDIEKLSGLMEKNASTRSPELDIDSHPLRAMTDRLQNMMWFCGTEDLAHRDVLVDFAKRFERKLDYFPNDYFHEGFRSAPKGVSRILFLTRASHPGRIEEALLHFTREDKSSVDALTALGTKFKMQKTHLVPSIRTPVGLSRMDI